ncbi:MarR family transcriptional regulator [Parablautia intestinalis]|uniref:MarR family transcriptional regulator n=1 Tax=Parablautia intestinalis TaxID=2320100 RepID=UPI00256F0BA1|nr:MarR family transcriptional regulator [Parablautia intestinalis]
MIPLNPWEHQNAIKTLYSKCVEGVCVKHNITRMELDILLFLANNPCFDTAADIIEVRYLSKSQVSSSIKLLEQCGYIRKEHLKCNRKTAHLRICKGAMDIIHDGQAAQEEFISIMLDSFSREEIDSMKKQNDRILRNINTYLKGKEAE